MCEYYPSENCLPNISGRWNLLISGPKHQRKKITLSIREKRSVQNSYSASYSPTTDDGVPSTETVEGLVANMGPNMCTAVFGFAGNDPISVQLYFTKDKSVLKMYGYGYDNSPEGGPFQVNAFPRHR